MGEKPTISISVIGYNEAQNIARCFESLDWADEIVFVDCESMDNSIQIARKYTNKIFIRPNLENLNINKSFGIEQTVSPWVLYLDPDEIIPEETSTWILKEIKNPKYDAYLFPRKNHILDRWLKHGSQYPDYQLRLFKKNKAHFPHKHVHERLQVNGTIGKSIYPLLHYPYPDLNIFLKKFNFYTTFEAKYLLDNPPSKLSSVNYIFIKPISRFIKRYLLKGGFLDGFAGFVAAFFDMINFPVRYFKYIELKKTTDSSEKIN
jgi:glycosyltransferase involved in cell wall biosynthesis